MFHYNNFDKNIKTLLDTDIKNRSIDRFSDSSLNYDFNNGNLVVNDMYVPSTLSTSTLQGQ